LDDLDALENIRKQKDHVHMDKANPNYASNKEMILDEANFGYTPKNTSYLKRK
jgi:hypothetical protein